MLFCCETLACTLVSLLVILSRLATLLSTLVSLSSQLIFPTLLFCLESLMVDTLVFSILPSWFVWPPRLAPYFPFLSSSVCSFVCKLFPFLLCFVWKPWLTLYLPSCFVWQPCSAPRFLGEDSLFLLRVFYNQLLNQNNII